MLNGVSVRYKQNTRLVLMSLAYAIRPLRLYELSVIANLPEPSDVLRIYTSCLVRMVPMPGKSSRMNKIEERASRDTGPFFSQGISTIRHLDATKTRRGFILPCSFTFTTSQPKPKLGRLSTREQASALSRGNLWTTFSLTHRVGIGMFKRQTLQKL